jgi:uncharacterized repeat protein (TIGR03803 family)
LARGFAILCVALTAAALASAWAVTLVPPFATLYAFSGGDGRGPYAGLIFDSNLNLWGTTLFGGASGYGTVFELSPAAGGTWTEKFLYSFQGGQ